MSYTPAELTRYVTSLSQDELKMMIPILLGTDYQARHILDDRIQRIFYSDLVKPGDVLGGWYALLANLAVGDISMEPAWQEFTRENIAQEFGNTFGAILREMMQGLLGKTQFTESDAHTLAFLHEVFMCLDWKNGSIPDDLIGMFNQLPSLDGS